MFRSEGFARARMIHRMLATGQVELGNMPTQIQEVERIYLGIFKNHLTILNRLPELNLLMYALSKSVTGQERSEEETEILAVVNEVASEHVTACLDFIAYKLSFVDGIRNTNSNNSLTL